MPASGELARRVVEAGRRCSLTTSVLGEWASAGSPKQVEYLARYLEAEAASRDASKRASLLRRCGLPAPKTFDGCDWSAVSWPEGLGREDLLSLSFLDRREDLVLMGGVGTGKTHMASALCRLACDRRMEARFFTASSLVARLRRARDEGRVDREASQIGRARPLVVDELGFPPLDPDGARLLFQVFADAYERQSVVITTNLEFSRWGSVFGDDQMAAAVIDRIVHHGRLVQFRGESYRVRHALMQEGQALKKPAEREDGRGQAGGGAGGVGRPKSTRPGLFDQRGEVAGRGAGAGEVPAREAQGRDRDALDTQEHLPRPGREGR